MFSDFEIDQIVARIENAGQNPNSFLKTKDLFAIRQLLENIPELSGLLFNKKLVQLITELSSSAVFLTKAIYFDKPIESNWFVPYHQDLSISVNKKADVNDYVNWTSKKDDMAYSYP